MAVQPGLCKTWSKTPKTGFLATQLKCYHISLKGTQFKFPYAVPASSVVLCDGRTKDPPTPSIVQIIFFARPLRSVRVF